MPPKRLRLPVVFLACLVSSPASAATKNWIGANNGDWNTSGNWNPSGVPGASDDVVLNASNTVSANGAISVNSLTIRGGSSLTHPAGLAYKLELTVAGDFTVESGAAINVSGKGIPGTGSWGSGGYGMGGGGHAGPGGSGYIRVVGSYCYDSHSSNPAGGPGTDSYVEPALPGGGGGMAGGGVVLLQVGGTARIDGQILADGGSSSSPAGGGAGGTINIHAGDFRGGGTLRANGGSAGTQYDYHTCQYWTIIGYQTQNTANEYRGGGGAGGRIAVWAPETSFNGSASAGTVFHTLDRTGYLTAVSSTSFRLDWTADATGPRYVLRAALDPGMGSVVGSADITRTTHSFSGLTPRTTYFVEITNLRFNPSPGPLVALVVVTSAVDPAAAVISGIARNAFTLEWNSGGNGPDTLYRAEIATDPGFQNVWDSSTTLATGVRFTGLSDVTTYYARVAALNGDGTPTGYASTLVYIPNLATPAGLILDAVAPDAVTLSWPVLDPPNPAGTRFTLGVSETEGSTLLISSETVGHAITFGAGGAGQIVPNSTYYFVLQTTHTAFQYSTATVTASTITPTAVPTGPAIDVISRDVISFSWDRGANPSYTVYSVDLSAASDFSSVLASSLTLNGSVVFTGLDSSTTYYLRVAGLHYDASLTAYATAAAQTPAVSRPVLQTGGVPSAIPGTVGLWRFDEGSGAAAADASGGAHDGAITDATWDYGKFGAALSFNGSSAYAQVPDSPAFEFVDYTLEAWVKTTYTGRQRIVSQQDSSGRYWILLLDNGVQVCDSRDVGCPGWGSSDLYADGQWHHIAVVRKDSVSYRAYVDRKLIGTTGAGTVTPHDIAAPVQIGRYGDEVGNNGEYFNGLIDEVRVVNAALPTEQVTEVSTHSVVLSWTIPGNPNPEGTVYTAEIATVSDFGSILASTVTTGSVAAFGAGGAGTLSPNLTYYFSVTATSGAFTTGRAVLAVPTRPNQPLQTAALDVAADNVRLGWEANGNGDQTLYVFEVSEDPAFGSFVSSGAVRAAVADTRNGAILDNTTCYARVRAIGHDETPTDFDAVVSTLTRIAPPTSVYFDEITSHSLLASAYAPNPGFTNLGQGLAAIDFARFTDTGFVYQGWRQGGSWMTKADLPSYRNYMGGALVNGKIYVVGGENPNNGCMNRTLEVYDPSADSWTSLADLTSEHGGSPGVASVNGKVFAMGGWVDCYYGVSSSVEAYDPATNTWAPQVPLPPPARGYLTAVPYRNKIYLLGGEDYNGTDVADVAVFDPSQSAWSYRAFMPSALNWQHVGAAAGDKILAFDDTRTFVYDVPGNAWTSKTPIPGGQRPASAAVIGGKVYIVGDGVTRLYDPGTDTWTLRPAPPSTHGYPAVAAQANGRLYVIGGYDNNTGSYQKNDEYDPGVSMAFDGLTPNTGYSFKAKARNSAGLETQESQVFSVFTLAASPTGLQVVGLSSGSLTVTWGAAGNPDGTRYEAALSADDFQSPALATLSIITTTATFSGLVPGVAYSVRVRAQNGDGLYTDHTPAVSGTTRLLPPQVQAVGVSSITWRWDPVPGATFLLFAASDTRPGQEIVSTNQTAYTLTGLSTNTAYGVVLVVSAQNQVSLSDPATAYTLAAVPSLLAASNVTAGSFVLGWDSGGNPPVTRYEVHLSLDNSFFSRLVRFEDGFTGTSLALSQLSAATTYYVRVRAENSDGIPTGYGTLVAVTSPAAPGGGGGGGGGGGAVSITDAPTGLTAVDIGTGTLSWVWNGVYGATGYNMYWATSGALLAALASNNMELTGLAPNTAYGFRVAGTNALGQGPLSLATTAFTLAAEPAAPAFSVVAITSASVSWGSNGNPAGTQYRAELSQDPDFGEVALTSATRNAGWTMTALEEGTTYYVRVLARNGAGVETAYTATAAGVTGRPPVQAVALAPGAAASLVYEPLSGRIRVDIPAGAFSGSVTVSLRQPSSVPVGRSAVSDLRASGVAVEILLDKDLQPMREVLITVGYRESDVVGIDQAQLVLARFEPGANAWVPLPSLADPANHQVVGRTRHFSLFQLMAASPSDAVAKVKVYPNPFRPASGHTGMTFSNLPAGARIQIFSVVGESLRDLTADASGQAVWDGRNRGGQKAGSGVYYALIEGKGGRKAVRVAVER